MLRLCRLMRRYCVEMLDLPFGHYLSCTPGPFGPETPGYVRRSSAAIWQTTRVHSPASCNAVGSFARGRCGLGPGYFNDLRGKCVYPCWCSCRRDLQVGGNPWQSTCNSANCCNCTSTDLSGVYSSTHIGRMNFTGCILNGAPQGGWYSMPQLGRCTQVRSGGAGVHVVFEAVWRTEKHTLATSHRASRCTRRASFRGTATARTASRPTCASSRATPSSRTDGTQVSACILRGWRRRTKVLSRPLFRVVAALCCALCSSLTVHCVASHCFSACLSFCIVHVGCCCCCCCCCCRQLKRPATRSRTRSGCSRTWQC